MKWIALALSLCFGTASADHKETIEQFLDGYYINGIKQVYFLGDILVILKCGGDELPVLESRVVDASGVTLIYRTACHEV